MNYRSSIASSASEERLSRLMEERLEPGADRARIDERIWDLFGEEWAVVFTDLSGFSRKVEAFGIIHFLQIIYESERILVPVVDDNDGILLKQEGDSMLIIFRKPAKALRAAASMQKACAAYNRGKPEEDRILLCVGVGYGRMLRIGDTDVFGREVNASSKLGEDTAEADEVLATRAVVDAVGSGDPSDPKTVFRFEELPETPAAAGKAYRYPWK